LNLTLALFPVSIGPLHTCRTAHAYICTGCKYKLKDVLIYFWNKLEYERVNKISRDGTKI
jgi:hypothetical protein